MVIFLRQKITDSKENATPNAEETEPVNTGPTVLHSYQRTGCMAAFDSFSQFENYADEILDLLEVLCSPLFSFLQ